MKTEDIIYELNNAFAVMSNMCDFDDAEIKVKKEAFTLAIEALNIKDDLDRFIEYQAARANMMHINKELMKE